MRKLKNWTKSVSLFLFTLSLTFAACKNASNSTVTPSNGNGTGSGTGNGGGTPSTPTQPGNVSVILVNAEKSGTITATIKDGAAITDFNNIPENSTVIFTVTAKENWNVKSFNIDIDGTVTQGTKETDDKYTLEIKLTKSATLTATYKFEFPPAAKKIVIVPDATGTPAGSELALYDNATDTYKFDFDVSQAQQESVKLDVTPNDNTQQIIYKLNNNTYTLSNDKKIELTPNVLNIIEVILTAKKDASVQVTYTIAIQGMNKKRAPYATWGRAKIETKEKDGSVFLSDTEILALDSEKPIVVTVYSVSDWVLPKEIKVNNTVKVSSTGSETQLTVEAKAGDTIECVMQIKKLDIVKVIDSKTTITGKKGTFTTKSPTAQDYYGAFNEGRTVSLNPYSLGETELPYALWYEVYQWATKLAPASQHYTMTNNAGREKENGTLGAKPTEGKNYPATSMSWQDAVVWCNAYTAMLNHADTECCYVKSAADTTVVRSNKETPSCHMNKTKKGFRLPTEAEWEFAARYVKDGGDNTEAYGTVNFSKLWSVSGAKYPAPIQYLTDENRGTKKWNDLRNEADKYASYNQFYTGTRYTDKGSDAKIGEVKTNTANSLGLYNMSGNVSEWCFDKYVATLTKETVDNPVNEGTGSKLLKGGAWNSYVYFTLPGCRFQLGQTATTAANNTFGFRLACYE